MEEDCVKRYYVPSLGGLQFIPVTWLHLIAKGPWQGTPSLWIGEQTLGGQIAISATASREG